MYLIILGFKFQNYVKKKKKKKVSRNLILEARKVSILLKFNFQAYGTEYAYTNTVGIKLHRKKWGLVCLDKGVKRNGSRKLLWTFLLGPEKGYQVPVK